MLKHDELTNEIIKAAYSVHNTLGFGFLEKVYHNAMVFELKRMGLAAVSEQPINVQYQGQIVGEYFADILVADKVIVEIKAVQATNSAHETQLVNYLKATNIDVGLLLNFGYSLGVKRKVFETARYKNKILNVEQDKIKDKDFDADCAWAEKTKKKTGFLDADCVD